MVRLSDAELDVMEALWEAPGPLSATDVAAKGCIRPALVAGDGQEPAVAAPCQAGDRARTRRAPLPLLADYRARLIRRCRIAPLRHPPVRRQAVAADRPDGRGRGDRRRRRRRDRGSVAEAQGMIDWLTATVIATSALMALVLVIRNPIRRMFGAGVAYALWLLPAARSVLPTFTQTVELAAPRRRCQPPCRQSPLSARRRRRRSRRIRVSTGSCFSWPFGWPARSSCLRAAP